MRAERCGEFTLRSGTVCRADAHGTVSAERALLHAVADREAWRDTVARALAGPETGHADLCRRIIGGDVRSADAELVQLRAVADAGWCLLGSSQDPPSGVRFVDGAVVGWTLTQGMGVEDLLREVARRDQALAAIGVDAHPDQPVWRRRHLPRPDVRLPPVRWALALLAEGRTAREMSFLLGSGVFATTVEVARLRSLGLLCVEPGR